jgi:hypothetical protein
MWYLIYLNTVGNKILDRQPEGRRKPDRPRKRWLDDVTKDLEVFVFRGRRRRVWTGKNERNL